MVGMVNRKLFGMRKIILYIESYIKEKVVK